MIGVVRKDCMEIPHVIIDDDYITRLNKKMNDALLPHNPEDGPEYRDGDDPREFGRRYAEWATEKARQERKARSA